MQTRISPFRLAFQLVPVALAVVSCREPAGPDAKRTTLSPASSTQLTGTVGTSVVEAPSVTVRDASGRAVAGVAVTFSVRSGGGTIRTPRVVSSSDGVARVAAWTLGTAPGPNTIAAMNASGDSVVFAADAVAGPPFYLLKVDGGDGQRAQPGAALGVRPRVRVLDVYGNPLSGITVTFAVEAGGGSVSEAEAVSDTAGIAESGEWVLGSPGIQRMVARVGQLVSEPFTAKAIAPPFTCAPYTGLPLLATFRSELTAVSCKDAQGRSLEAYTIVVTQHNAYVFTVTSAEFDTDLELRDADLVEVAKSDDRSTMTNSRFKVLLGPGTYTLVVSSSKLGATGSYTLSYEQAGTNVERCEEAFIARGVTARGVVEEWDCSSSTDVFWDRFRIYLQAGSSVEILVRDLGYSGPNIELHAPDGSYATVGQGRDYLTKLVYTAPVDGYYTALVGLLNEYGVDYEISVR